MKLVLDADVLIGALDGSDSHHAQVRELFAGWQSADATRLISAVNLSEVLMAPAGDGQQLRRARQAIAALGVSIHQASEPIGVEAARLRHLHPISLPDAYCLATARSARAAIASFDQKIHRAARTEQIPLAAITTASTAS
jgi:predicted nucleic acid-binding protein